MTPAISATSKTLNTLHSAQAKTNSLVCIQPLAPDIVIRRMPSDRPIWTNSHTHTGAIHTLEISASVQLEICDSTS